MSQVEKIIGELKAAQAGVQQAQEKAGAADRQADDAGKRAAAAGFTGIVSGLSGVRREIAEIRSQIGTVGGSLGEAGSAASAAPKEVAPERTVATLTPAHQKIDTARQGLGAAITKVDETKQSVGRALRGGQPGPLIAALDAIKQVLLQVNQRCAAAKQEVEGAINAARRIGDSRN